MEQRGFTAPLIILGIMALVTMVTGAFYLEKTTQKISQPATVLVTSRTPKPSPTINPIPTGLELSKEEIQINLAKSHNANRRSAVAIYVNAIQRYIADHNSMPDSITTVPKHISKTGADLCDILIDGQYVSVLDAEIDPNTGNLGKVSDCRLNYDTNYTITRSVDGTKITIAAPMAELGEVITITSTGLPGEINQ